jgi:hypothetical protein
VRSAWHRAQIARFDTGSLILFLLTSAQGRPRCEGWSAPNFQPFSRNHVTSWRRVSIFENFRNFSSRRFPPIKVTPYLRQPESATSLTFCSLRRGRDKGQMTKSLNSSPLITILLMSSSVVSRKYVYKGPSSHSEQQAKNLAAAIFAAVMVFLCLVR